MSKCGCFNRNHWSLSNIDRTFSFALVLYQKLTRSPMNRTRVAQSLATILPVLPDVSSSINLSEMVQAVDLVEDARMENVRVVTPSIPLKAGTLRTFEVSFPFCLSPHRSFANLSLPSSVSIPVTIVVGIIVLLILYGIIRCCCCGGRRTRGLAGQRPAKNQAYSSNYAAPPPQMSGYGGPPPMNMNNNGYYAPPPGVPPPVHHSRLR